MSISFNDPYSNTAIETFERSLARNSRPILQNVWQYAERIPEEVYVLIDFESHSVDSFLIVDGRVVETLEFYKLRKPGFKDSEERRAKYLQFLANDAHQLEHVFSNHRVALPRRVWLGVIVATNAEHTSLDYTPLETELPPMLDAAREFREMVKNRTWPNPFLEYGSVE